MSSLCCVHYVVETKQETALPCANAPKSMVSRYRGQGRGQSPAAHVHRAVPANPGRPQRCRGTPLCALPRRQTSPNADCIASHDTFVRQPGTRRVPLHTTTRYRDRGCRGITRGSNATLTISCSGERQSDNLAQADTIRDTRRSNARDPCLPPIPETFALAVCDYPEHVPWEQWKHYPARQREMGLTYVRIAEFAWSKMEPPEGASTGSGSTTRSRRSMPKG